MRSFIKLIIVISLLFLTACNIKNSAVETEKKDEKINVKVIKCTEKSINVKNTLVGTAEPEYEYTIKGQVEADVKSLMVKEGDSVKKGQILVILDNEEVELAYGQAKIKLIDAKDEVYKIQIEKQEEILRGEKELSNAKSDYERKKILYNEAEYEFSSKQKLFNIKAATLEELKKAERDVKKAEIELETAESNYNTTNNIFSEEKNLRVKKYDVLIKKAKNNIEILEGDLKKLELEREKYSIRAYEDGIIADVFIKSYDRVTRENSNILKLIGNNNISVRTNISESDVNKVKKGDYVNIVFDAIKDQEFKGVIENIKPIIDEASRSFPVSVKISNSSNIIKPGMFCTVELGNLNTKKAIWLPLSVIRKAGSSSFVFKVKNGVAIKTQIKTGQVANELVEVQSGLKKGETVVIEGVDKLTDLAAVNILGK